jgi:homogentisate 1,2-dioxygenase
VTKVWEKSKMALLGAVSASRVMGSFLGTVMGVEQHNLSGFGNHFSTEALPGALPQGQNTPQKPAYGLYAEQLSGSAFTSPRHENLRSWLYRIRPSVVQGAFAAIEQGLIRGPAFDEAPPNPNPLRWGPIPVADKPTDFLAGLVTMAVGGGAGTRGSACHIYAANRSMEDSFFYNADGEMLFVPQVGKILLKTEFGHLTIEPTEIAVIPRGVKFQVQLLENEARGYISENYGLPYRLPGLGPIGSNGLANPRDFTAPAAQFENREGKFRLIAKFEGKLFAADIGHSPLDVVAWHGNYAPYKYDLKLFQTYGPVSFDHPDPSIFTVLTSPSELPGTGNVDFAIFPPRWLVMERSFRPPYFHRNVMSEFMGLIQGVYDGKLTGFLPGGASLHNCMTGHGPDADIFDRASQAELKPEYLKGTLAFMFESSLVFRPTTFAMQSPARQKDYQACWQGLKSHFSNQLGGNHGKGTTKGL